MDSDETPAKRSRGETEHLTCIICSANGPRAELVNPRDQSSWVTREFKQIATAGATTAAVTEKVWGEYVAAVCQILAK